jgi:hypothetical protein
VIREIRVHALIWVVDLIRDHLSNQPTRHRLDQRGTTVMTWQIYAMISAVAAGLTAVLAKVGVERVVGALLTLRA